MDVHNGTVFIPGATSGLGRELALRFAKAGSTVIAGGRREDTFAELAEQMPSIETVVIVTADPESIANVSAKLIKDYPNLNGLIAMAGIMVAEDWHSPGFLETAEQEVTTNILGPIRLIAALIDQLKSQPKSTIMTVSSGLGFTPLKITPTYNATKAAIHMLTESVRTQLADTSVQLVELVPPAVQTELMPGQSEAEFAMGLDDFIDEVVALIENNPDATELLVKNVKRCASAKSRAITKKLPPP